MHSPRRLLLLCGTLATLVSLLAGFVVLPASAHAAAPQHVNFSGSGSVDLCGMTVTVAFKGVDNFFPVFDSSGNLIAFKETHQEQDTFTAANGKSIDEHVAQNETSTLTANPDGTFTEVFTYKGLPEQLLAPNGPVLTQDAGLITFVDLFSSTGQFISQTITVENGPHPDADSGSTLFCQVVTAALS